MNSIRLLTPFERGQAAYADALSHVDYPAGSDALLQWGNGLCSALLMAELAELDGPVAHHGQADTGTDAAPTAPLAVGLQTAIASTRHSRRQAQQLADVLQKMVDELAPVIEAHLRCDGAAVHQALTAFVAQRCRVVDPNAGSRVLQ